MIRRRHDFAPSQQGGALGLALAKDL